PNTGVKLEIVGASHVSVRNGEVTEPEGPSRTIPPVAAPVGRRKLRLVAVALENVPMTAPPMRIVWMPRKLVPLSVTGVPRLAIVVDIDEIVGAPRVLMVV